MHLHFAQGDTQDTTYVAYLSCVTNVRLIYIKGYLT